MDLFRNGVGRPSNETIKKRNIFKGICFVFGLIIIGLVGYILNDKEIINLNNKKTSNSENGVISSTTKKDEITNISTDEGEKLIVGIFGANHADMYYRLDFNNNVIKAYIIASNLILNENKTTSVDLNKNFEVTRDDGEYKIIEFKNSLGNGKFEEKTGTYLNRFLKYSVLNKTFKETFIVNEDLPKENIIADSDGFIYSDKCDCYASVSFIWGDGGHIPMYSILKAYNKGNSKFVEVLYADATCMDVDNNVIELKDKTEIKLTDDEVNDNTTLLKYEGNVTKVVYKFTKENGVYKFDNVKEIN